MSVDGRLFVIGLVIALSTGMPIVGLFIYCRR